MSFSIITMISLLYYYIRYSLNLTNQTIYSFNILPKHLLKYSCIFFTFTIIKLNNIYFNKLNILQYYIKLKGSHTMNKKKFKTIEEQKTHLIRNKNILNSDKITSILNERTYVSIINPYK